MTIQIYKSYGVLGHEKQPVYSVSAPASDIYDLIAVNLPCKTWRNGMNEVGVTLDGEDYLLSQVLTNWGDAPALVWLDRTQTKRRVIMDVVAE